MKRRAFLQIAGGMIVGAMVGGNAPNPVVFPARPYNNRTKMQEQMADMGEQLMRDFAAGIVAKCHISWRANDGGEKREVVFVELAR